MLREYGFRGDGFRELRFLVSVRGWIKVVFIAMGNMREIGLGKD